MSECRDCASVAVAVTQGDSAEVTLTMTTAAGSPVDCSDWSWRAQIRDESDVLDGEWAVTVEDADKGVIHLAMTPAASTALAVGDYVFDVEATDDVGGVRTLVDGQLRIKAGVSR